MSLGIILLVLLGVTALACWGVIRQGGYDLWSVHEINEMVKSK